jgi:hypothetical protein
LRIIQVFLEQLATDARLDDKGDAGKRDSALPQR